MIFTLLSGQQCHTHTHSCTNRLKMFTYIIYINIYYLWMKVSALFGNLESISWPSLRSSAIGKSPFSISSFLEDKYSHCYNVKLQFSSVPDGIYALEKAHIALHLRSFPNVAFEIVPMLV